MTSHVPAACLRHAAPRLVVVVLSLAVAGAVAAQTPSASRRDSSAIQIMDRMADMIGNLNACSFTLRVGEDVRDPDHGTLTRFTTHQVYMSGPNRMHMNSLGEQSHRGYWYDGERMTYYNFTENNYGVVKVPGTTMEAIDRVHADYGVDFPAADFFFPTFTDDILAQSTRIQYIGTVRMEGKECFRILATGPKQSVQLWIANDATFLPVRFIFTDHDRDNERYEGAFSDWALNPEIPDPLYRFQPPPGASPLRLVPRNKTAKR